MTGALPRAARRAWTAVSRLTVVEWTLIHWYVALGGAWPTLLIMHPPAGPAAALGPLYVLVIGLLIAGATVATAGAIATAQTGFWHFAGFVVEAIGLLFLCAAVLSYLFTQIALVFGPDGADRIALIGFVYSMLAALMVRALFLVRQYMRAGHPEKQQVVLR